MTDSTDWAGAVFVANKMLRPEAHIALDDERVLVEQVTKTVTLGPSPTEAFSPIMPVNHCAPSESELFPIDILYGRYFPEKLRIEIYFNRIRADAPLYGGSLADFLSIVRTHEYAHAAVHIAVNATEATEELTKLKKGGPTDWGTFRRRRNLAFSAIDDESHELLAQAITWACLSQRRTAGGIGRLAETFLELEKRQAQKYHLPPTVRQSARFADWAAVLRAARREIDVHRGPSFTLAAGLRELIIQTAEPRELSISNSSDVLATFASEMREILGAVTASQESDPLHPGSMELLLDRRGHLELRMYKETAHQRPHFHLEYKSEYEASYALDNFERLAGWMPAKYEKQILPFAQSQQRRLLERWHSLNGSIRTALPGSTR